MNQTWENGEKPNLVSNYDLFGTNLAPLPPSPPKKILRGFYLY